MSQRTEYKIVVTRIERDVPYKDKEYEVVSDVETPRASGVGTDRERKYDYVETDKLKDVDTKVYEQIVDDIDLGGLAVFINTVTTSPVVVRGNDGSKPAED